MLNNKLKENTRRNILILVYFFLVLTKLTKNESHFEKKVDKILVPDHRE
jgi:hypothetical protein